MSPAYDWRQLADLFKPASAAESTRAIVDLRDQGMTASDIATALGVDLASVTFTLARLGL